MAAAGGDGSGGGDDGGGSGGTDDGAVYEPPCPWRAEGRAPATGEAREGAAGGVLREAPREENF